MIPLKPSIPVSHLERLHISLGVQIPHSESYSRKDAEKVGVYTMGQRRMIRAAKQKRFCTLEIESGSLFPDGSRKKELEE